MLGEYSPQKVQEMSVRMREAQLLADDDVVVKNISGDSYSWTLQTRGHLYFTERAFIFYSAFEGYAIPYTSIKRLKKCLIGRGLIPVFPIGMMIFYETEDGKQKKARIGVMKRKLWLQELSDRSGVPVE